MSPLDSVLSSKTYDLMLESGFAATAWLHLLHFVEYTSIGI